MIARIWRGQTKKDDLEAYTAFLKRVAMPDYEKTEGFIKLLFLRNLEGDRANFTLITFWESLEKIKNFAGQDYQKAKYYPEDSQYLLHFPEQVSHFEVFAE